MDNIIETVVYVKQDKIGFTGTRKGMTQYQLKHFRSIIKVLEPNEFYTGGCIGSDGMTMDVVHELFPKCKIFILPASDVDNKYKIQKDYATVLNTKTALKRNKDIVNKSQILIATPASKETLRSGTWSTIRYAKKINKRIIIIPNIPGG